MKLKNSILNRLMFNLIIVGIAALLFFSWDAYKAGKEVDNFKGVPVYQNSFFTDKVHGENYSTDGYYYGLMWQCVEFVQRYYYDALGHKMPDPTKDAKDYFNNSLSQGAINEITGLRQFKNGSEVKPEVEDIVVFTEGRFSKWGHVAIVSEVGSDYVEIVQQNFFGKTREKLILEDKKGSYLITGSEEPAGWLRK